MNVYILFSDKNIIGVAGSESEAKSMLREYEFAVGCADCGDLSFKVVEVGEYCD